MSSMTFVDCVFFRYQFLSHRWSSGHYIYNSLENRIIYMASFLLYYNLNKYAPDRNSFLGRIQPCGPLQIMDPPTRAVFEVSSLAPEHVIKSGNFGFRSVYRPIDSH
jgi:hypothetical protein